MALWAFFRCKSTQNFPNLQLNMYFCSDFYMILSRKPLSWLLLAALFVACKESKQTEPVVMPWGEVADSVPVGDDFDLDRIQASGELILLTITGPQTYYDYHGRHLGTQYMLAQRFADRLGVGLRVEVCRDSAEMAAKLSEGDADIMASPTPGTLVVSPNKPLLAAELKRWYRPQLLDSVRQEEDYLLSARSVKRRVFSPMLDRKGGVISHYDQLFIEHSKKIRWDWKLMAAQCYQESTFDPQAKSWAGACGLMQIMPSTADHLGLPRSKMFDPEQNIAAAARYLGELEGLLNDIPTRSERLNYVLASYNGGLHHIRDAMALAQRDGKNPHRWADVSQYVLKLAQPEYYNDPIVKHGYMRGSETYNYVLKILERWDGYRGIKTPRLGFTPSEPRRASKVRKKKYDIETP